MKHNREFEVAWQGLKPGPHTFIYDIGDEFMQERGADETYKNWMVKIKLVFDKHESFFMLHFDIDGVVTMPCDRCGDEFSLKLWDEFNLIIKLTGEDAAEIDEEDDVVFIPRNETVIDLGNWVYEFVMLSVPLQHIHPGLADGQPGCNQEALRLLNELSEPDETIQNPIWKGLENFKKKPGATEKAPGTKAKK